MGDFLSFLLAFSERRLPFFYQGDHRAILNARFAILYIVTFRVRTSGRIIRDAGGALLRNAGQVIRLLRREIIRAAIVGRIIALRFYHVMGAGLVFGIRVTSSHIEECRINFLAEIYRMILGGVDRAGLDFRFRNVNVMFLQFDRVRAYQKDGIRGLVPLLRQFRVKFRVSRLAFGSSGALVSGIDNVRYRLVLFFSNLFVMCHGRYVRRVFHAN